MNRSVSRSAIGASLALALTVLPVAAHAAPAPAPRKAASAAPLASVEPMLDPATTLLLKKAGTFALTKIAEGMLTKIGDTAMGKVLQSVMTDPTAAALAQISAQLTKLQSDIDDLEVQAAKIMEGVSQGTLTTLVNRVAPITDQMDGDLETLNRVAHGYYKDAANRQAAINKVTTNMKKLDESNALQTLQNAISGAKGGSDILTMAFKTEWDSSSRFYTNKSYAKAADIVAFYVNELTNYALLYAEYKNAQVTTASSADFVSDTNRQITDVLNKVTSFTNSVGDRFPSEPTWTLNNLDEGGDPNNTNPNWTPKKWSIDKTKLDHKYTVWLNTPDWWGLNHLATTVLRSDLQDPSTPFVQKVYRVTTPSLADFRHLASGYDATSNKTWLVSALQGAGFTPTIGCIPNARDTAHKTWGTVYTYWTSDWAELFGMDNTWQGRDSAACMNIQRYHLTDATAKAYYTPQ